MENTERPRYMYVAMASTVQEFCELSYDEAGDTVSFNTRANGSMAYAPYISINVPMLLDLISELPETVRDRITLALHDQEVAPKLEIPQMGDAV